MKFFPSRKKSDVVELIGVNMIIICSIILIYNIFQMITDTLDSFKTIVKSRALMAEQVYDAVGGGDASDMEDSDEDCP